MKNVIDRAFNNQRQQFEELISPLEFDDFMSTYWQQDHMVLRDRPEDSFDHIITIEEIDETLSNVSIPINQVDVGTKAVGLAKSSYQRGSYADPKRVLEHHKDGHSIILRSMQMWFPGLRQLTNSASRVFNCPVKANIYLTPAGGQSSTPHWDAHDIFVLQLCGAKTWDIHESFMPLPHPNYEFDSRVHPVGELTGELSVSRGQCAYIPRGCVHNPHADSYSVHVALGVQVKTVDDAIRGMVDQLTRNIPALRKALPVTDGVFNRLEIADLIAESLERILNDGVDELDSVLETLAHSVSTSRHAITNGILRQFAADSKISLSTRLAKFPSADFQLVSESSGTKVTMNGVNYKSDTFLNVVFQFVVDTYEFTVSELPMESNEMKIAFAERLLQDGAIRLTKL